MHVEKLYGQERSIRFLKNAITNEQISHAYLLSGGRGLGKRNLAAAFAQSLICEESPAFSGCTCSSCHKVTHDSHPDIKWVGLDESERSIKLETVRSIHSWIALRPLEARRKVCIINYAERMTEEAANAFLKTLEEPPANSFIIFIVEHTFQLLDTIVSRLVEVRLDTLPNESLCNILQRDYGFGNDAHFFAYQSQGSIGLALEYKKKNFFTLKNTILDSFLHGDKREFFLELVKTTSKELDNIFYFLCGIFHDVLLLKHGVETTYIINQDRIDDLYSFAQSISANDSYTFMSVLEDARRQIKRNVNAKLILTQLAVKSEQLQVQVS